MHADGKERSQNDLLNNFNTPPPQKKVLMRNRENKQMRKR